MGGLSDLSPGAADAIGYIGGGFLAICMWPQLHKIITTRSAADISYSYTALYVTGLVLTLVYLLYEQAIAAWIPLLIEIVGALAIAGLKYLCDSTSFGDRGRLQRGDSMLVRGNGSCTGLEPPAQQEGQANGSAAHHHAGGVNGDRGRGSWDGTPRSSASLAAGRVPAGRGGGMAAWGDEAILQVLDASVRSGREFLDGSVRSGREFLGGSVRGGQQARGRRSASLDAAPGRGGSGSSGGASGGGGNAGSGQGRGHAGAAGAAVV